MIKKQRKLQEYYQFNLVITKSIWQGQEYYSVDFKKNSVDINFKACIGKSFDKLTDGQWLKAKKYLTRELIAFQGYRYSVRDDYKKEAIYKII